MAEMKCEKAGHSRVPSPLRAGQIVAFDDFAGDGVDLTEPVGRSTQAIAWIAALDMAVRPFLLIGFIADGMKRETRQLESDAAVTHGGRQHRTCIGRHLHRAPRPEERRVGKEWGSAG